MLRSVEKAREKATVLMERMTKEAGTSPAEQRLFTPHSKHSVRQLQVCIILDISFKLFKYGGILISMLKY